MSSIVYLFSIHSYSTPHFTILCIVDCYVSGNKAYRGFLYLEHTYNNPVANAFVALLIDGSGHQKKKDALLLNYKGM